LELTKQTGSENDKLDSTPLERRNQILTKLLFNAPLANRVSEMYEDFFVSIELIGQKATLARLDDMIDRVENGKL
ncbi:hypothetical protein, partial [Mordavella massiliensis]|uniref:hypothetical protein n=1 Tax=Mordavella massiliensis TaxID=1871024 RepID=UPI00210DFA6A|nr:hypothetical protein [Mordavella massiliensis]